MWLIQIIGFCVAIFMAGYMLGWSNYRVKLYKANHNQ